MRAKSGWTRGQLQAPTTRPHAATPMASRCTARYAPHACAFRALRKAPIPGVQLTSPGVIYCIHQPACIIPAGVALVRWQDVMDLSSEAARGQARGSKDPWIDSLPAAGCQLPTADCRLLATLGGGEERETETLVLCKAFDARRCKRRSDGLIPASSRIPVSRPARSVRCSEVMRVQRDLHRVRACRRALAATYSAAAGRRRRISGSMRRGAPNTFPQVDPLDDSIQMLVDNPSLIAGVCVFRVSEPRRQPAANHRRASEKKPVAGHPVYFRNPPASE